MLHPGCCSASSPVGVRSTTVQLLPGKPRVRPAHPASQRFQRRHLSAAQCLLCLLGLHNAGRQRYHMSAYLGWMQDMHLPNAELSQALHSSPSCDVEAPAQCVLCLMGRQNAGRQSYHMRAYLGRMQDMHPQIQSPAWMFTFPSVSREAPKTLARPA